MTRGELRAALEEGDLDGYRVVSDALASEFDPLDVAAAAVKLVHRRLQADAAHDEEHIPSIDPGAARERPAKSRPFQEASRPGTRPREAARRPRAGAATMARLYVSAGSSAGLRPADLVGAITNEAGISAREIGAIEIEERYSLVEVSDSVVDDVIRALRGSSLRGRKVTVRKDQPKRSTKQA
jgi:ATP-dependent RNA helicase DeaD